MPLTPRTELKKPLPRFVTGHAEKDGKEPDWRALAFGVSVGGFGIAIGSLANLIAVRLSGERGMWGPFHLISIPFWFVAAALGAWLV